MNFALRLYKFMSSQAAKATPNLFFSPISIHATLSTLALGARSTTRREILQGMGLNDNKTDKELHECNRKLLQKIFKQTKDVNFNIGNEIFIEKSAIFFPQYQDNVTYYYNTSIQSISFSDTRNAIKTINTHVSKKTDNKIQKIVEKLDSKTMMVPLDYSVFQAKWESQFDIEDTEERNFTVNENKTVSVPTMRRQGLYRTFKDKEMKSYVVEVPYTCSTVLLIIVPELGNLHSFGTKLTPEMIKEYLSSLKNSMLDLYIPRVSFNNSVNVQFATLSMDMRSMFSGDNANFSKISKKPRLRVSKMCHQTYANFTEEGREMNAAAVSQSNYVFSNPKFKVNRPFLMLVYNKNMEIILWMGRVIDPSK
uniref:Thyroxine-binding globulin n=2 Tax=Pyxicephalus adspersus TaxID=30357 RepID=A0AAV2ZK31_PYXAD|nr:TPA: hypothetical protein GDO54_005411 [Pyxicephalus adspersus]